jgi:hypothetical protein
MNYKLVLLAIFFFLSFAYIREASGEAFDKSHKLYADALSDYVKDGLVDYAGLKSDPGNLVAYLESTAKVTKQDFESWTEDERLAFLINIYNARTLELIVDNYPVKSIRDIGSGGKGPWDEPVVKLFGETITLNSLEHGIIRRNYNDPRIHFALVCAARGCPPLLDEPYLVGSLQNQLEARTKIFLGDPEKNSVDRENKILRISPIFVWYAEDFKSEAGSVPGFLKKYYGNEPLQGYIIVYTDYDWSLNDISSKVK